MPSVERQDIDGLNAIVSVTVDKSEYIKEVKAQLKKAQARSSMKGFRAGKAPLSIMKKMYGKQIVFEEVNKLISKEMNEYLDSLDRELLGNALPMSDEETPFDFRIGKADSYTFKFKLGFAPQFELKGYSTETVLPSYTIKVKEETIDKEIENLKSRLGEQTHPEDNIQEKDVLKLELKELDEEAIKEGGVQNTTTAAVDLMSEELQKNVMTMKLGDSFNVNIYELDSKMEGDQVGRYILGLSDDDVTFGENFVATIEEITRNTPAEINEEFIAQAFPKAEGLETEEDIRNHLSGEISKYFNEQADKLMLARFQRHLMDINEMEFPTEFLKEWMLMSDEKATKESIEEGFEGFLKGLKWSLIQTRIADKEEVKVTTEEIELLAREEIAGYFGGNEMLGGGEMIESMVERFMQDKEYINRTGERIINERITVAAKNVISFENNEVTEDEFNEIIKAYNEENEQAEKSLDEEFTDAVEELVEDATVEVETVENETTEETATESN